MPCEIRRRFGTMCIVIYYIRKGMFYTIKPWQLLQNTFLRCLSSTIRNTYVYIVTYCYRSLRLFKCSIHLKWNLMWIFLVHTSDRNKNGSNCTGFDMKREIGYSKNDVQIKMKGNKFWSSVMLRMEWLEIQFSCWRYKMKHEISLINNRRALLSAIKHRISTSTWNIIFQDICRQPHRDIDKLWKRKSVNRITKMILRYCKTLRFRTFDFVIR